MGLAARLGWGLLGLLVALGVGLMFWLDWLLGAIFAVFVALVLWYVFGVLKKKIDVQVARAAGRLGLTVSTHPFRYASMAGIYQGRPVKISYESSRSFGLGSLAVTNGAPPALAALDASNITLVRMEHQQAPMKKRLLDPGPPPLLARGTELRLALEGVCTDAALLGDALKRLASQAEALANRRGE